MIGPALLSAVLVIVSQDVHLLPASGCVEPLTLAAKCTQSGNDCTQIGHDDPLTHVLIGAYIAASFMDAMTTAYCRGARTCHEANPALRPFQDRPLVFGLVKGGATAGISYLLLRLHRGHPRLVRLLAGTLAALSTYVAVQNVRTSER